MFRFLCCNINNKIVQRKTRDLWNGGDSTIQIRFLCSSHSLVRRSIAAAATSDSIQHVHENSSFKVSYLTHSCGLSLDKATSVSKKVHFVTSTQPDSVLTLFRNHEIPNTNISKIIQKRPELLLYNAHNNLKPKLEFFRSIGILGPDLANVLSKDPSILSQSLGNTIIPSIAFIKTMVLTDSNVTTVLKRSVWVLKQDLQIRLAPKIAFLRTLGVPRHNILNLLLVKASTLINNDRFYEIVDEIKKMKFDPSKYSFTRAILVLSCLSKSSWEAKFSIYKRWGWSEEDIRMAFRRHPMCMGLSENKIMETMGFLVNKMGYDSLLIVKCPLILSLSLQKRIMPRLFIIQALISNGLVRKDCHIQQVLQMSDKNFLDKFVINFEEKIPLLKFYQEKMNAL